MGLQSLTHLIGDYARNKGDDPTMKYVVIVAHPNPDSFTQSVCHTAVQALEASGHEVKLRDLYKIDFNPLLSVDDFKNSKSGEISEDVKTEQQHIAWADALIVIYPLWWASLPAILKGYVDRVFSYGFAYSMDGNGLQKLLSGKAAVLFTTMGNTEEHYNNVGMFEAMRKTVDEGIFDFVGIKVLEHKYLTSVTTVDNATREQMLEEVKSVLAKQKM